ncbi:MAG TPA: type II secretion system protein [Candidatus Bathyarchaeia archaeon]|nr:type II secretion system protein [Candidatus Bathyarchaeia archaeon]
MKRGRGFTLVELIVSVVIVGVIASLALGQYYKLIERADERHAIDSLLTIASAERMYYAKHGDFWPGTGKPLENITVTNAALGTNIQNIPGRMTITCGGGEIGYQCRAFYVQGGVIKWEIESRAMLLEGRPFCNNDDEPCPMCKNSANGGCV